MSTGIIGYDGQHSEFGYGLYCVDCWACADDATEIASAIEDDGEYIGVCTVCGTLIGQRGEYDERDPDEYYWNEEEPTEEELDDMAEARANDEGMADYEHGGEA